MKSLCFAAAPFLISAVLGTAPSQAAEMFRGDPSHSGVYDSRAPEGLPVRWCFKAKEAVVSSPAVADGVVYFGSLDNHLYAVDALNGTLRWSFDAKGDISSSPAVSDGRVVFLSLDGRVHALDTATGREAWAFQTGGERRHTGAGMDYASPPTEVMPDPWDFFLSSPVVTDGRVYVGSGDGNIYALREKDGSVLWKFQTGNVVHATPTVSGRTVFCGSFDTYFYALDADTGAERWKFKTGEDKQAHLMTGIPGSACVANGLVMFGCRDANVYCLDAQTGGLRWRHSTGNSWVVSSPAVKDGRLYFTTSDSLKFTVLNALTGEEIYSLGYGTYSFSSPALAGGHAYFGTFDGMLHDVNLELRAYSSGFATPGWKANADKYLDAEGKLRGETMWIGETLDDSIVAIRTRLFSLGSLLSSPVVKDGVVYIGSVDGGLYALGK